MRREKPTTKTTLRRNIHRLSSRVSQPSISALRRRFIKSTGGGKQYFVIPVPSRKAMLRVIGIIMVVTLVAWGAWSVYRYFGPHNYQLSRAATLLSPTSAILAKDISYDTNKHQYTFTHGISGGSSELKQTGATTVSATIAKVASKGVVVTDPNYKTSVTMAPTFALADGQQASNRIVYPFRDHGGWLVYTATGTGIKEDIILEHHTIDTRQFSYSLKLPDGTEARKESDGSIGIYGNEIFMGSVTPATDADASLLEKARKNAQKNLLLFTIPKPTVIESGRQASVVDASFDIKGDTLTVTAKNLAKAKYPLSIDPSIYIVTAQQFMNGNNETNVDFDVANKLIKKAPTTGARFDAWNATMGMNVTKWKQGVAVAGGYIYTAGGVHPEGGNDTFTTAGTDTFTVPAGVTSITVKAWGAGGGGGGAGGSSSGGAGGGGGYATTTLSVTPNESLTINVGGGGGGGVGGGGSNTSGGGGGGGGYSRVARGSTSLIIAAGGAGGGGGGRSSSYEGGAGGAGGGASGQNGSVGSGSGGGGYGSGASGATGGISNTPSRNTGSAGTSLLGGAGADGRSAQGADGSANNGGVNGGADGGSRDVNNYYAGAGGGGGGYAGGGGGSDGSSSSRGAGGGGGGSSYTTGTGGSTTAGSGTTPANDTDSDRASAGTAGAGGTSRGAGTSGSSGIIIITYTSSTGATNTVAWARFNTSDGTIESTNPGDGVCSGWCSSSQYNLPSPRGNFSLAAYSGFLYAIGGEDASCTAANGTGDNGVCKTVYVAKLGANGEPQLWHPSDSNKANWVYWYRDADLSSPRSGIKAVAYNNRLYLMGGVTSASGTLSVANSTQIADITPDGRLGSWTSSTTLPYATYGYSTMIYNDRIYLVGGASSIGGSPLASVYYSKINSDGTLNSWQQTTSMKSGRMSTGGDFSTVWGAYLYVSGGCSTVNASGYCTTIHSDTQVASLNADGSLDIWNTVGNVSDTRTGHSLIGWRGYLYEVGGCSAQNTTTGYCTSALGDINVGKINQDGDASTVGQSVAPGTAPCSGATPTSCNMPGTAYIGNMLNVSIIANGYLYVIGGCLTNTCGTTSANTAYTAISSTGLMTAPPCVAPNTLRGNIWCVDTTNTIAGGIAAASPIVFNDRLYLIGGLDGSGNTNTIYRNDLNANGSLGGAWQSQSLTGLGMGSVSYSYAYARANPADATTTPGNMFLFGGCSSSNAMGCTAYSSRVYKCNIQTTGAIASCSTSGQLQIDAELSIAGTQGLGIMSGTVYANYVYLIGGVTPNSVDLKSIRYAKIDSNNNIVPVSGSAWIQSPYEMAVGRRRSAAFGYNGYIYAVGGYEASTGVLADIEFIKVNVSDGSLGSTGDGWHVSAVQINQRWGLSVPVSNSYAYVIGGCTDGASPTCNSAGPTDVVQTFQIYNNDSGAPAGYTPASNTYPSPNRIGTGAAILNGNIYLAGGCTTTTDCAGASADVFYAPIDVNGNIGVWQSTASLPQGRAWGKLLTAKGALYYIGGQTNTATDYRNEVYYVKPSANGSLGAWAQAASSVPAARTKFGATVWNDHLYIVGGGGSGTGCTALSVCNTVYVSPAPQADGNLTGAWSSTSTGFNVARSGTTAIAYANNLYLFGGFDGANYLSDSQYSQLAPSDGSAGSWTASESLPTPLAGADGFAANGYIYIIGGRSSATSCDPSTLVAPVSANTTISTGNNPTGIGAWYTTNQRYSGARYGNNAVYSDGKAYVVGGGCGATITYGTPTIQQTTLLSQPQVAKYSIMIDTDTDVFPNYWLLNGVDNSIGARWQLKYRSMANQQATNKCATMNTWGQETNFGDVSLGLQRPYVVKDGSGTDISCGRYYYFNVTVDSSQAFGYPDDVARGPTITDLTLQFTADPSKRLMHGRTFTGGVQMPNDTPKY